MAKTTEEQLIDSVVTKLRNKRTAPISSVVNEGGGIYLLNTNNTFDVVSGVYVSILGNSVLVREVVSNTSIKVLSSADLTLATSWTANFPYFFYGNPVDINNERNLESDQRNNYPAIILFEVKNIVKNRDKNDIIQRTPTLRLYFMDMCEHNDKTISEIYTEVLDRMEELSEEFVDQLEKEKGVYIQDESYRVEKFSKWAVRVIRNNQTQSDVIFDNQLTGVGIEIDVPMSNALNCLCC